MITPAFTHSISIYTYPHETVCAQLGLQRILRPYTVGRFRTSFSSSTWILRPYTVGRFRTSFSSFTWILRPVGQNQFLILHLDPPRGSSTHIPQVGLEPVSHPPRGNGAPCLAMCYIYIYIYMVNNRHLYVKVLLTLLG